MNNRLTLKIIFYTFVFQLNACNYGKQDMLPEKLTTPGFVKVRIWNDNLVIFGNKMQAGPIRAGHVSLETAQSYLSLWPIKNNNQAQQKKFQTSVIEKIVGNTACMHNTYEQDFEAENSPPDHVFILFLGENTKKIDELYNFYKNYAEKTQPEKGKTILKNVVKWHFLGSTDNIDNIKFNDAICRCHCATFAIEALIFADESFKQDFDNKMKQKIQILYKNESKPLNTGPILFQIASLIFCQVKNSTFSKQVFSTFLPTDFAEILQARMKKDLIALCNALYMPQFVAQRNILIQRCFSKFSKPMKTQKDFFAQLNKLTQLLRQNKQEKKLCFDFSF